MYFNTNVQTVQSKNINYIQLEDIISQNYVIF